MPYPPGGIDARNENEVADLYQRPFVGKMKGKYRLSRKALLVTSNRRALRGAFLDELKVRTATIGLTQLTRPVNPGGKEQSQRRTAQGPALAEQAKEAPAPAAPEVRHHRGSFPSRGPFSRGGRTR